MRLSKAAHPPLESTWRNKMAMATKTRITMQDIEHIVVIPAHPFPKTNRMQTAVFEFASKDYRQVKMIWPTPGEFWFWSSQRGTSQRGTWSSQHTTSIK